jgi:hypothetical protein
MAVRRWCRADFLLGLSRYFANAFHGACIELLGLLIGDQYPFDEVLASGRATSLMSGHAMSAPAPTATPVPRLPPFSKSSNSAMTLSLLS